MSIKQTNRYSICMFNPVSFKLSVQLPFMDFPVASSNYSRIRQTLYNTAFNNFPNQSLSTSSLFSSVKCLERCRVFDRLFPYVDLQLS